MRIVAIIPARLKSSRLKEKLILKLKKKPLIVHTFENAAKSKKLSKLYVCTDSKKIKSAHSDLRIISGQQPLITKAKKSIAGFKLRKGLIIGCKVTLRKNRMYEFLDRLIYIALPRVRDFKGLSKKSFDGNGNYSIGIKEQIIFPEINYDKIDKIRGMDISIVTSTCNEDQAYELLKGFNFPINNKNNWGNNG